jgi:hypothetical protein
MRQLEHTMRKAQEKGTIASLDNIFIAVCESQHHFAYISLENLKKKGGGKGLHLIKK